MRATRIGNIDYQLVENVALAALFPALIVLIAIHEWKQAGIRDEAARVERIRKAKWERENPLIKYIPYNPRK